ncbi:MAG TPA: glycosyltransferase family 39 protein [Bryobacteraceae bacterium]|nr:glycosyltransferase family 39 protein [Bryobacteraceae bacterium]
MARGLFYCVALPLWEGFDEPAHYAYAQYVALGRGWLVGPETRPSREVERSVELVPMPWILRFEPPPHETYDTYFRLPLDERRRRERELIALPRALGTQDAATFARFESQQPPLSYWLMAPLYAMLRGNGVPERVFWLRILNLLLASTAVPAARVAARRVFGKQGVAVATAALVALMPEVLFDAARVANSGLTIALYSALTVLCISIVEGKPRATLWAGLVLGLGLLTKAFFLTALPALGAVVAWAVWRRRTSLGPAIAGFGLAAIVSGWWYVRNIGITGSLSGNVQDAALRHMPITERLGHAADVSWLTALDSIFFTHIWFGGWSFLQLRAWIYHVMAIVAGLALVGLAVAWAKRMPERRHLAALAAVYFFFCAGLAYHVLMTLLANGISSSAGWYLCAVVVPEAILVAAGLRALAPRGIRKWAVGGLAGAFALIDLYGMLFVALPYYAGVIIHRPDGSLQAFHWAALAATGPGEMLRRIAVNKPEWMGPGVVAATGCVYVAATLALGAIGVIARRGEE